MEYYNDNGNPGYHKDIQNPDGNPNGWWNPNRPFHGQMKQDKFVLNCLKFKKNDYFLEIGSRDPARTNNTYLLEKHFDWKGIMVEWEKKFEEEYKQVRPNSIHLLGDARCFDYKKVMDENNFPKNLGFLQIDIEVCNDSTIDTLKKLDNEIFDYYKFATVCFEHDFYCSNFGDPSGAKGIGGLVEKSKYCRDESRKIFTKRGYYLVFNDLDSGNYKEPTEDWWVHPDLIDMKYIKILENNNKNKYRKQIKPNEKEYWINYTGIDLLNYKDIVYPNYFEYKISEVFNYVKKKIKKLEIKTSPYEHVCINDFFPEDFYNETLQEFIQIMEEDNKLKLIENEKNRIKKQVIFQNKVKVDYNTVKIINFIFTNKKIIDLLVKKFPNCDKKEIISTDVEYDIFYEDFDYPIHDDSPKKNITLLLYLAEEDICSKKLGTHMYDINKKYVDSSEYKKNNCFIFCRDTNRSWHNMSFKTEEIIKPRKTIQIILKNNLW